MTSTTPGWTGPQPEHIAAWNLVQAGHLIGRRFHRAFAELGLTPTQFGVLLELHIHPDASNNQIARSVLVTPQTMSELLDSLDALGLVERDPTPGRGHRIAVNLTAAGADRLQQCATAVQDVEQSLGLTPPDRDQLNHLLNAVLTNTTATTPTDPTAGNKSVSDTRRPEREV